MKKQLKDKKAKAQDRGDAGNEKIEILPTRPVADPIAIVGMAFRFPGDLGDESDLWASLKEGRDLVGRIPADRWAVEELQHANRSEPGRSITFSAGVLSRIDEFDAAFFGISPREAAWLDPQQRLLLELAWEAMENGGIVPSSLAGSNTSVCIGISGMDYGTRGMDDLAAVSPYSMTGNTLSIAANRLSYVFDLRGPSFAIDTACSSSLVALHQACNLLHAGDASVALVGGVNLLLHPYSFVGFTKASMLSATGRCRVFDAGGDGYVRAEGGVVLLLKPLAKALADGDDIRALILASGTNADGARKTGITIPSAEGQAELMRSVLARSGLSAHDIDFVEAHGTGTAVGDPIEAAAIGTVYGKGRARPLPIGSVKANLGHMEPASGMAGLVKAVLALKNRALPPALHLDVPNPNIDFGNLNLEPVRAYRTLAKESGTPLVAGVNSFGFGGANAHVLLQEARSPVSRAVAGSDIPLPPLFLSARSENALRATAERYAALLDGIGSPRDFYDIAYAAAHRRERMEKRLVLGNAESVEEAAGLLRRYANGETQARVIVEEALPQPGGIALVYSGNGAQWVGMGRALLAESARFAEIIDQLDVAMRPLAGFSLADELRADGPDARLDDTVVAQPLLFAIQVAITLMLKEQGVVPTAVAGHSVGEVAAAWAAGALDLGQAVRIICARSAAQGATRGAGRMAVVGMSKAVMQDLLAEPGADLDIEIAGINSPNNVTLSGSLTDLERIRAQVEPRGVFFRLLDLDYAFHSRRMDAVEARLAESLAGLSPQPSVGVAFVSTVTGDVLENGALASSAYWWRNVRWPVRFADAVARLADLGCRVFIEIGPHAILQRHIGECLAAAGIKGRVLATLRKGSDGPDRIVEAALRAHLLARNPDLAICFPISGRRVRLPNYPWQRERHWHPRTNEGFASFDRRRVHPLLGWRLHDAGLMWENVIDPVVLPWLADHEVGGAVVFPGSAYAELALAAAREWLGGERLALEELGIVAPLVFDGGHARTLCLTLDPRDGSFQIKSRRRLDPEEWTLHAAGRVFEATGRSPMPQIGALPEPAREIDREAHYRLATMLGLEYGPSFRGLGQVRVAGDRLEGTLETHECVQSDSAYLLHPAVLDVCYQSLVDFFQADIEAKQGGGALLPVRVGRLDLFHRAAVATFRMRLRRRGVRSVLADFELLDIEGKLVARVAGCRFRAAFLLHQERMQARIANWRVVPWLCPHPATQLTTELPSSRELAAHLRACLDDDKAGRRVWFKETLPLFEALTLSFAFEACQALASKEGGDLRHLLETADSRYARWLADLLRQEGLLGEQDGQWRLLTDDTLPPAEEIWQLILHDAPASLPQLTLLGRVGRHLPELLDGRVDGRQFLETLRSSVAAETLYGDDPAYAGIRLALERALRHLAAVWPGHRRLRVLEIAAAPSELPRGLVDALPEDRLEYVLALVDEETCQRQQMEYQQFANVIVTTLDIGEEKLSFGQPQSEGMFDVIIFRHALHRTVSPHAALTRVRCLLAAGGLLLLAERYPDWSADFVAGLDPSWWHEEAAAGGRMYSSLLSPETWRQTLLEEGFDEVDCLTEPAAEGLTEGAYLLLARRPGRDTIALPLPEPATWLLVADAASQRQVELIGVRLESQGQRVIVVDQMPEADADDIEHVVHFGGWSSSPEDVADGGARLLRDVQRLAARPGKPPRLWLVTCGGALVSGLSPACAPNPAHAALWGFGRVVMNEYPALDCTLIDLNGDLEAPDMLARIEHELLRPDGTNEIVLAGRGRYGPVMLEVDTREGAASAAADDDSRFHLDFRAPGQLRHLVWLPDEERPLRDHEIEVRVRAAGLNFRDVMYLMGLLPDEAVENGFAGAALGLEFSGVVARVGPRVRDLQPGDAVMGFGASCFASHVVTRADAVAPMPEEWAFESAATVPTVFFTAYYALKHLADLQPGERVLIHGAAGGVGIAAIQLARHLGAEVFATAGSDEKRDFARLLGADHVFDSRSLAFADDLLSVTGGEGVDVVLNSLAGEAVRRNLGILRPFGRFLELGKRDFYENTPIGLRPFKDNISYFGIDADQLLIDRPRLAARLFHEVMALFRAGVLAPLPYRVFTADRVVDAFRAMQQARHIGKIVVSLSGARPMLWHATEATRSVGFAKESTWLVTGGLAGFGLASARWLATRGVGNLVLLGRRGEDTPGAREAIEALAAQGVNAKAFSCDITDAEALAEVIDRIRETLPPLKGILHAAMVIDDRLIARLDAQGLAAVLRPKLLGAWNLHQLTLDVPLEHFVLYSSMTTCIGNPGQAGYVAANAGLEGLAELRRYMGLPVTCIGWGPIADAGYLVRNPAVKDSLAQRLGRPPLAAGEAMVQLGRILAETDGDSRTVADFDWNVLSRLLPSASSHRFIALNRNLKNRVLADENTDFRTLIIGKTADQIAAIARNLVIQEVAQILRIAPDRIESEANRSLYDFGMDSLMAVELVLGLERRFGIQLPVMMLNESTSAERVAVLLVEKLFGSETTATGQDATSSLVEDLARQHGEAASRDEIERTVEDARALAQTGTRLIR